MFKKVVGKICKNQDCPLKDKLQEPSETICDCGHELKVQTVTDKKKLSAFLIVCILILGGGGYLAYSNISLFKTAPVPPKTPNESDNPTEPVAKAGGESEDAKLGKNKLSQSIDIKKSLHLVSEGLKYVKKNKFQEAESAFRTASQKDPQNDQAFGNLGAVYIILGKHSEAFVPLLKAISLNPKNSIWHLNIAELYSIKGEKDKALEELETAITNGFREKDKLNTFNFKALENDPKFVELINKIDKR